MGKLNIEKYLTKEFWSSHETEILCGGAESQGSFATPLGSILFQTSGSSGAKKWVVHTRETLLASAKLVVDFLSVTTTDCWLLALPVIHVGGFGILARSYVSGCRVAVLEDKWSASNAVGLIRREKVTLCSFVPTQIVDIVRLQLDCPDCVRAVIVGGGKLDFLMKESALKLGWPILESYGMTETGSQIATQTRAKDESLKVIGGWETRTDEAGCLEVRGDGLMKGYLVVDDGGEQFVQPFSEEGWFRTSDRVDLDQCANTLNFVSRNDRRVKILGELVDLDLLEASLLEQTGIEVLIIDIADERRGVKLIPVVENNSHTMIAKDLDQFTGLHKLETLMELGTIPRNAMGKLDRVRLREMIVILREEG